MIQGIRNKHLQDQLQVIVLDKKGTITESDNYLFHVGAQTNLEVLHPFFETGFTEWLKKPNFEQTYFCIHLNFEGISGTYDIYFNSGNSDENPYLVFYDYTKRYASYQNVAQEKNESILDFRKEALKNEQLKREREFKNKFLANISHDLRTPIASVLGFLEILDQSQLNFNQKDLIKTISLTGSYLSGLVEDLLDIAKIESGDFKLKIKSFNFKDFQSQIEKIYLFKAAAKNLDFIIEIDQKLPSFVIADRVRLMQIVVNTMDNAMKFTEKGEIKLVIKENFRRADNLGLFIQVSDTGIGFSSRNKARAFESFTKLHDKDINGLGLGLSIVQQIVTLMNGTIKLKSVLKKGTIIEINISVKIDLEISTKNKKIELKEFLLTDFAKKYNILVVDDNETNQLLIMKILANHGGFFVDISDNGKHAIELVEKNDYDLILMDIDMPIMDGITASNKIRNLSNKKKSRVPIIALSANPTAEEQKKCKEIGIKDYLARPFTREELFLTIYKCLKNKKYKV